MMKEKKPKKILLYCKNPACFAHYIATKKLKLDEDEENADDA